MARFTASVLCLLLCLTATLVQGGGRRRHHTEPIDGEFSNFDGAVAVGGGGGYGPASPSLHGTIEDEVPFDPRLADPPCLWTTWSGCDTACGGGSSYRLRRITDECAYGPAEQLKVCNTQPCPSDCQVGEWGPWGCGAGCSACSVPCGGGTRTRTRPVTSPALFGGRCDYNLLETEPCNEQECPVECVVSEDWSNWGSCDRPCGGGRRARSRQTAFISVVREGDSMTAAQCPESVQDEPCGEPCPQDCVMSEVDWSQWSSCSATCGDQGTQTRSRPIAQYPQNGGNDCLDSFQIRSCAEDESAHPLPACPTPPPILAEPVPSYGAIPAGFRSFRGDPIILPPVTPAPVLPAVFDFTATTELSVDPAFCQNKPDGPYEHPDCLCCNDLIMCFQRAPIIKWCPPGEVFVGGQYSKCMKRAIAPNC